MMFQFHKVRLKGNSTGVLIGSNGFQFHKVRLKDEGYQENRQYGNEFQFHKVRLKVRNPILLAHQLSRFNSIRYD